jgi:flavorubredoxin
VVYESMYGNTHLIAEAVGAGLREYAARHVVAHPSLGSGAG